MIAHNRVFITDPNYEDEVAGGGLFVSYDKVSRQSALVNLDVHIRNTSGSSSVEKSAMNCMTVITVLCFQQRNDCPWAMSMRQKWPLV